MKDIIDLQLQRFIEAVPQIAGAVVALIVLFMVGHFAGKGIEKILGRGRTKEVKQIRLITRLVRWAFNLMGIVIALNILGLGQIAASFLAAGGVMAVVLGFAFREIGENLLAGLFLSFSRSFNVGDIIESNGIRGIVKYIEIREVHIRTGDGCDIFIPSAMIYKNPLHNFTRDGLRRGDFVVGIDYGDDPELARELLLATVQRYEKTLEEPPPSVRISGFNPNYIELQVYFWINTFTETAVLSDVRSQLMNVCHRALSENNFTFSSNVSLAVDMKPVDVKLDK
jgi:small-conductance mechanosensitive channel